MATTIIKCMCVLDTPPPVKSQKSWFNERKNHPEHRCQQADDIVERDLYARHARPVRCRRQQNGHGDFGIHGTRYIIMPDAGLYCINTGCDRLAVNAINVNVNGIIGKRKKRPGEMGQQKSLANPPTHTNAHCSSHHRQKTHTLRGNWGGGEEGTDGKKTVFSRTVIRCRIVLFFVLVLPLFLFLSLSRYLSN